MEAGKYEGFSAKNAQGLLKTNEVKMWISQVDEETQLRVCITAHCGAGGRCGSVATKQVIAEQAGIVVNFGCRCCKLLSVLSRL